MGDDRVRAAKAKFRPLGKVTGDADDAVQMLERLLGYFKRWPVMVPLPELHDYAERDLKRAGRVVKAYRKRAALSKGTPNG